jgi:hypothetical protein
MCPDRLTLLAAVAALAACAAPPTGARYHDASMDFGSVRTVVVLPFQNLSRDNAAAERTRDVFATMLMATGAVYVVPQGETARALVRSAISTPATPGAEDVIKLGKALKADAVITGVVREYGEVRSGSAVGNAISMSVQMLETATGKLVWTASTTRGGVSLADRLVGSGGTPMNQVTEAAVDDLLNKLFK